MTLNQRGPTAVLAQVFVDTDDTNYAGGWLCLRRNVVIPMPRGPLVTEVSDIDSQGPVL